MQLVVGISSRSDRLSLRNHRDTNRSASAP